MRLKLLKNNKGTALLMILFMLSGILIVALGAANLIIPGIKMSRNQISSTKSYFAAETGIEEILITTRINEMDISGCDATTNKYLNLVTETCAGTQQTYFLPNSASYVVIFVSDSPITFRSTGSYRGTKRSIEVSYTN